MIYIFSSKVDAALKRALELDKKPDWVEVQQQVPAKSEFKTERRKFPRDQAYLDISGLDSAELKKAISSVKKITGFWGIIDPKGIVEDPASFFFEGAGDYIGPALIKKGLSKKRFEAALLWANSGLDIKAADGEFKDKKKNQLPTGKFSGWKSISAGTTGSFFFLFVSLSGKSNLRSLLGEAPFNTVKKRLRDVLQQKLWEADALLWMEKEDSSVFLVPPRAANGKSLIEAVMKILLNSRLITIEDLGLSIQVEFTFALHYGSTIFQAPGKTGEIISESINYIYHLGTKKAETGRLTISDDVPDEVVPLALKDFFRSAGIFEKINIRHSRRFVFR